MAFKKGQSGNKKGRPIGSKNKTPEQIRIALMKFIDDNMDSMIKDFKSLDTEKRLTFFEKIVRHVLPAPTSFEKLSETQLDQLHEYLKLRYNEQKEEN